MAGWVVVRRAGDQPRAERLRVVPPARVLVGGRALVDSVERVHRLVRVGDGGPGMVSPLPPRRRGAHRRSGVRRCHDVMGLHAVERGALASRPRAAHGARRRRRDSTSSRSPTTSIRGSTRRDTAPSSGACSAVAHATSRVRVGTGVTCPIVRTPPALVAHAAATTALMFEGRFFLGVGAGEALNEHVMGQYWPPVEIRHEMLTEALVVMRELWKGETVDFHAAYFTVENARLYDVPDRPSRSSCPRSVRRQPRSPRSKATESG